MMLSSFLVCGLIGLASSAEPPGDLLAGPAVIDLDGAATTIVRRGFDGRLVDVGPEPDVAAIELLDLTNEQRQRFEQIMAERTLALDEAVRRNLGLIQEFGAALTSGDARQATALGERLRHAFRHFLSRGSAFDELSDALSDEQRATVRRMLAEYRRARFTDLRKEHGDSASLMQLASRARLESFGQLVRQSIERRVALEQDVFEAMADELDLTIEQQEKIRAIFTPIAVQRFQGNDVDPAAQAGAFREMNRLLTAKQRWRLTAMILSSGLRDERPTPPATGPTTQPESVTPSARTEDGRSPR